MSGLLGPPGAKVSDFGVSVGGGSVAIAETSPPRQGETGVSGRSGLPGKRGVKVGSQTPLLLCSLSLWAGGDWRARAGWTQGTGVAAALEFWNCNFAPQGEPGVPGACLADSDTCAGVVVC